MCNLALVQNINDFSFFGTTGVPQLYVSSFQAGTRTWTDPAPTHFPLSSPARSFMPADASFGQCFVAVSVNDYGVMGANDTRALYLSDASGLYYTRILDRVLFIPRNDSILRNRNDILDFVPLPGIESTYMANIVTANNRLATVISFDKGGMWTPINPPDTTYQGSPISPPCTLPNCSLHLHSYYSSTLRTIYAQSILTESNAPGLILATGNLGSTLSNDPKSASTYLSPDGGFTWKQVLPSLNTYRIADHGGVIMAVPLSYSTNTLYYSVDEGNNFVQTTFNTRNMYVGGAFTEPGATTDTFSIWGLENTFPTDWMVVTVSFSNILSRPCNDSDYYLWQPTDGRTDDQRCVLGGTQAFSRRLASQICWNGRNFTRPTPLVPCACMPQDFEWCARRRAACERAPAADAARRRRPGGAARTASSAPLSVGRAPLSMRRSHRCRRTSARRAKHTTRPAATARSPATFA